MGRGASIRSSVAAPVAERKREVSQLGNRHRSATRRTRIAQVLGVAAVAATLSALALWGTRARRATAKATCRHRRRAPRSRCHDRGSLDAGAELRWTRTGHRTTAHQRRGAVHWTVATDDLLVLDSGGVPSAGTIEASGASLRGGLHEPFGFASAGRHLALGGCRGGGDHPVAARSFAIPARASPGAGGAAVASSAWSRQPGLAIRSAVATSLSAARASC